MHFVSSNTTIQRNEMHFDVILIRRQPKILRSYLGIDRCYPIRILSLEFSFSWNEKFHSCILNEIGTCRYQLKVLFLECTTHSCNYRCEPESTCRQRKSTGTNWKWSAEWERMIRTNNNNNNNIIDATYTSEMFNFYFRSSLVACAAFDNTISNVIVST